MPAHKNLSQKIRRYQKKSLPLRRVSANHSAPLTFMAVVNSPYVGISRGRLGEGVFYRAKGNTNLRSYNPSPQNRRTVRQQAQRSLFSSAVKFFSRGIQNLFVFAYEDKRTQESDYNAFMRYNAKSGVYFGPSQNSDPDYPALGRFVLSQGSLQRLETTINDDYVAVVEPGPASEKTYDLVSQLSQDLVYYANYQQGDIITFLTITSDYTAGSPTAPVVKGMTPPRWLIRQLIVDINDTRALGGLGFAAEVTDEGNIELTSQGAVISSNNINAYAAIHSRLTAGSLKVSDADLILSVAAAQAVDYGRSSQWRAIVEADWQTEPTTILQGSVAQRAAESDIPTLLYGFDLPAVASDLAGQAVVISDSVSTSDIIAHLAVVFDGVGRIAPTYGSGFLYFTSESTNLWSLKVITGPAMTILEASTTSSSAVINSIYWDA